MQEQGQGAADFEAFERIATSRRSVKSYDTEFAIDDDTLRRLFELVVLSPSSFNMQHWRFVVVRDPERMHALKEAAMGQPQVADASAAIVVCGKLSAHEDAAAIYAEAPAQIQERVVPMITGFYQDPVLQRDEAIRSGSLAAMSLMYAAEAMGLATGPMIGFDPERVANLIELGADYIPVMLVVLGKATGTMRPRMSRLPLDRVVRLEAFTGKGLSAL